MKRKDREESSGRADGRYRSFFAEVRDAVFVTTREGTVVDCNQSALELFGYTREEMKGLNARWLYACPEDREKFQQDMVEKKYVKDYEMRLRRKDGTVMLCLYTSAVLRAGDGTILGYQGVMRYVSEHDCEEKGKPFAFEPGAYRELPREWLIFAKIYGEGKEKKSEEGEGPAEFGGNPRFDTL